MIGKDWTALGPFLGAWRAASLDTPHSEIVSFAISELNDTVPAKGSRLIDAADRAIVDAAIAAIGTKAPKALRDAGNAVKVFMAPESEEARKGVRSAARWPRH